MPWLAGLKARIQALPPDLIALAFPHGTITLTATRVFEE